MTTLHHLTPPERHGEALAVRSMTINAAGAVMPVVFGFVGGTLGAVWLLWLMALGVASGSLAVRGTRRSAPVRT